MEVVERLHEILGAAAPARQLRDEYGVDVTCLGESHHLLALDAVAFGARGGLLEDTDDSVAAASGKCAEITLLTLAGLVVGADPAVDSDLSQLNLVGIRAVQVQQMRASALFDHCIKYSTV